MEVVLVREIVEVDMARVIPDTISEEELRSLVKAAKKNKLKAALTLMFFQCFRVSELTGLDKSNIDFRRGFVHIKQSKGKKDRDSPIQEPSKYWLRFIPINMTRQGLHKAIKKLGIEVLDKDIHPHTLRHSGASFYLNDLGMDIKHIQDLLGHEKISTTQIYLHVNPEQLKNAFEEGWRRLNR